MQASGIWRRAGSEITIEPFSPGKITNTLFYLADIFRKDIKNVIRFPVAIHAATRTATRLFGHVSNFSRFHKRHAKLSRRKRLYSDLFTPITATINPKCRTQWHPRPFWPHFNLNYLFKKTQQLGHLTCNNTKPTGEKNNKASAYLKVENWNLKKKKCYTLSKSLQVAGTTVVHYKLVRR